MLSAAQYVTDGTSIIEGILNGARSFAQTASNAAADAATAHTDAN